MTPTTLETVLATATSPGAIDIEEIRERRARLTAIQARALPVERDLVSETTRRLSALELEEKVAFANRGRPEPLPLLDPSVFTWRHEKLLRWDIPVPRLALIPALRGAGTIQFATSGEGEYRDDHRLLGTEDIDRYYSDVYKMLATVETKRNHSHRIYFEFKGAVPDDVRDLIGEEKARFNNRIYLLADAPFEEWTHKSTKVSRRQLRAERARQMRDFLADPLVLGNVGGAWLILSMFDPTPIESYIAAEFAHKQLGT